VPELPEVEALARFLEGQAGGHTIMRMEPAALSALKTFDPPLTSLVGGRIRGVERRGKYVCFRVKSARERWLVIHLALGGWVQWRETLPPTPAKVGKGPLALRVGLSGGAGFDVTEQGTEKRLAIWAVDDPVMVPGIARLGPDPLDSDFDVEAMARVLGGRTGNIKTVLTDQSALAGVGNAYSDEALHAAHLSPFRAAAKLDAVEVAALHAALVGVLRDAVTRSAGLPAKGLKGEKKSGMAVHGRTGLPCPACGDTVREVSFATRSLQYCPTCQTGGKPLADRRLSRLLK
jgi:formamidopyrimidine-DNA glycosylase